MEIDARLCEQCGENEKEWLEYYCQICWEGYCAGSWWEILSRIDNENIEEVNP